MEKQPDSDELWMVLAIIQPFKLDAVTLALEAIPHFNGMTVSECRGFGHGTVEDEVDGASRAPQSEVIDFTTKLRVEIAVRGRAKADSVIGAIATAAHTGNDGDGKIFSWPLERAVRIRTLSEGSFAL